jgi:CubicO group peptidase (beta-lactamase class C family)
MERMNRRGVIVTMKRFIVLVAFVAALCGTADIPDTPAGKRLAQFLAAFDAGDRDALVRFHSEGSALGPPAPRPEQFADMDLNFRKRTGGMDLKTIETKSAHEIVAVLKQRETDNYVRIRVSVETEPPHRVNDIVIGPGERPASEPPPARMTEADLIAAVKQRLAKLVAEDRFSGVVLVARNGKPVLEQAHGYADREKKIPNNLNTRFALGSMNKMMTAVAVAQLAQAGKIKFNDPVGKYLPGYPNQDVANKVTVHHLLTHTGGVGDIFGPQFRENKEKLRELKDYVALYGSRAPQFEPGAKFSYANYGFLLLGVIIENVSGKSYYDYVRDHVFKPAGMTQSGFFARDEDTPNRANGYTHSPQGLKDNRDTLPWRGTSAGGGYSTAGDLLKFAQALLSHKLLDVEHTSVVTTGKVDAMRAKYAYGVMEDTRDGVRQIGHGGGAPGMNADLVIMPDNGYVVVALANLDPPAAENVSRFAVARLPVSQ